jgi:hypothetical protein
MAKNTSNAHSWPTQRIQAGQRQLNAAIRLHFEANDPVVVITLAAAASAAFADLAERRGTNRSWKLRAQEVLGFNTQACLDALGKARRFLKLDDRDDRDVLEWSFQETEALILATAAYAEALDCWSLSECIYWLWYCAKYMNSDQLAVPLGAAELFPGIVQLSDDEQRARGAEVLRRESARLERSSPPARAACLRY